MKRIILSISLIAFASLSSWAVTLPAIFSDNMVLEQNSVVTIWGWGKTREPIAVVASWNASDTIRAVADTNAKWSAQLHTPAGSHDSYTIDIIGYNSLSIHNVGIGEVVLCSGQSNMEWTVNAGFRGRQEVMKNIYRPDVRMFNVDYRTAEVVSHDVTGKWEVANTQTIGNFSAIGYLMACKLSEVLNVVVGVVNSSWGGTPIEVWTNPTAYEFCDYLRTANETLPKNIWGPQKPGSAYNAMIAPLEGFKFSCIAWYQGEANVDNQYAYTDMMFSWANSMRELFGANLPIVYAQIGAYHYNSGNGVAIRERQRRALDIPNTAMVVIGELSDTVNIHPAYKMEAAERFANAVLNTVYGKKEYKYAAPLFKKMDVVKNKAYITFDNAEGLCTSDGKAPDWFEVAGADGKYVSASAKILKDGRVELSAKGVATPVNVRYAWSDTAMPNLRNAAGVQASSFNTADDF